MVVGGCGRFEDTRKCDVGGDEISSEDKGRSDDEGDENMERRGWGRWMGGWRRRKRRLTCRQPWSLEGRSADAFAGLKKRRNYDAPRKPAFL